MLWVWLYPQYLSWERKVLDSAQAEREAARERAIEQLVRCINGLVSSEVTSTGDISIRVASIYLNKSLVWSGSLYIPPMEHRTVATSRRCGQLLRLRIGSVSGNCWSFPEKMCTC